MNGNDQVFELIMRKLDSLHDDVRQFQQELHAHIEDDQQLKNDVWFIKRAFQTTWTALVGAGGLLLAWMSLKD